MSDDRRPPSDPARPQRPIVPPKVVGGAPKPPIVPAGAVPPKVPAAAEGPAKPATPAKPVAPVAPAAPVRPAAPARPATPVPPVVPKASRPTPPPAPRPTGPDPRTGRMLGRCRIGERVGQGRTATVYRAHHEGLGADVAVKVLLPQVLAHPEIVAQFEQEARVLAQLDHPNLVKVYDVVTEGEDHGLVMEFLEGESVLDYVTREGRLDPQTALRVVRHAAAGLQAAHARGLIHRDVKPQNLVILEDGSVRLVDFGLATATGEGLAAERIGTPHYMAPEVCEAKPASLATDTYGLGITLYHLLTGKTPYAGKKLSEILAAHIAGAPLQPEREVKGLAPAVADLVRAMTRRVPAERPTMEQVIATLDGIGGTDLVTQPAFKPRTAKRRRALEARQRRKQSSSVLILLLLAGLAGVVVLLLSRRGGDEPEPTPTPPREAGALPGAADRPAVPATSPPATPEPAAPVPAAPTAAELEAARKAQEAEAARQAETERLERARTALAEVETYARENWQNKDEVVRRYRLVTRNYGKLEPGKEAKRRADGIEKGELHAHPDRTISPPDAVEAARAAWEGVRASVDTAIAEMRYDDALRMIPTTVEDPEGVLVEELTLWRGVTRSLTEFHDVLTRELASLKGADRNVTTPKGTGPIVNVTVGGPQVRLGDEVLDVRWADLGAAEVAALSQRAFAGKDLRLLERLAVYAWAHRLRDPFFQAAIGVKAAGGAAGAETRTVDALMARAQVRFAK